MVRTTHGWEGDHEKDDRIPIGGAGRRRAAVRLWWLHTSGSCGPVSFTRRLDKSGLVAAGNSRSRSPTDRCSAASASVAASRHKPREWGITVNPVGAVLPNAARTPGAVNPSVSQANIDQTICASGWTATVRPPASFTTRLKKEQLASGYTYQGDTATRDYEEDHLISLEIGGAPTAEANLWPEPYNSPEGAGSRTSSRESSTHWSVTMPSPWQPRNGPSQPTGGPAT